MSVLWVIPILCLATVFGTLAAVNVLKDKPPAWGFNECSPLNVTSIVVTGKREDGGPITERTESQGWLCYEPVVMPASKDGS